MWLAHHKLLHTCLCSLKCDWNIIGHYTLVFVHSIIHLHLFFQLHSSIQLRIFKKFYYVLTVRGIFLLESDYWILINKMTNKSNREDSFSQWSLHHLNVMYESLEEKIIQLWKWYNTFLILNPCFFKHIAFIHGFMYKYLPGYNVILHSVMSEVPFAVFFWHNFLLKHARTHMCDLFINYRNKILQWQFSSVFFPVLEIYADVIILFSSKIVCKLLIGYILVLFCSTLQMEEPYFWAH